MREAPPYIYMTERTTQETIPGSKIISADACKVKEGASQAAFFKKKKKKASLGTPYSPCLTSSLLPIVKGISHVIAFLSKFKDTGYT